MGYFGRIEDRQHAQELRRKGLSYKEILKTIHVAKSTISEWCKDIELTDKQKRRLLNKKEYGQRKGSLIAAENKRNARVERTEIIRKLAKRDIGKLSDRDRFMTGIALYAAEGNKADGNAGFANSDPYLIRFMMIWFTKSAKVPMNRMRGAIWLHEGLSEEFAKKFWSDLTKIPQNQFHKTYIAKVKNESKKVRKNIHRHGVFTIRFSDSAIHRKIMGWIYAMFSDKIIDVR
jgi:hypothetical protein